MDSDCVIEFLVFSPSEVPSYISFASSLRLRLHQQNVGMSSSLPAKIACRGSLQRCRDVHASFSSGRPFLIDAKRCKVKSIGVYSTREYEFLSDGKLPAIATNNHANAKLAVFGAYDEDAPSESMPKLLDSLGGQILELQRVFDDFACEAAAEGSGSGSITLSAARAAYSQILGFAVPIELMRPIATLSYVQFIDNFNRVRSIKEKIDAFALRSAAYEDEGPADDAKRVPHIHAFQEPAPSPAAALAGGGGRVLDAAEEEKRDEVRRQRVRKLGGGDARLFSAGVKWPQPLKQQPQKISLPPVQEVPASLCFTPLEFEQDVGKAPRQFLFQSIEFWERALASTSAKALRKLEEDFLKLSTDGYNLNKVRYATAGG